MTRSVWYHLYVKYKQVKLVKMESKVVVTREWEDRTNVFFKGTNSAFTLLSWCLQTVLLVVKTSHQRVHHGLQVDRLRDIDLFPELPSGPIQDTPLGLLGTTPARPHLFQTWPHPSPEDPSPGLSTGLTWATRLPPPLPREWEHLWVWRADRSSRAQTCQQARERGKNWFTSALFPVKKETLPTQT